MQNGKNTKIVALALVAIAVVLVIVAIVVLVVKPGGSNSQASSPASTSVKAASSEASQSVDSQQSAQDEQAAAEEAARQAAIAQGKQLATGTVVVTTNYDRAREVIPNNAEEFKAYNKELVLLMLDEPVTVTAPKANTTKTGEASVIKLPDGAFGQYDGQTITIGVDSWGGWPSDIAGALYDVSLSDRDGVVVVVPVADAGSGEATTQATQNIDVSSFVGNWSFYSGKWNRQKTLAISADGQAQSTDDSASIHLDLYQWAQTGDTAPNGSPVIVLTEISGATSEIGKVYYDPNQDALVVYDDGSLGVGTVLPSA